MQASSGKLHLARMGAHAVVKEPCAAQQGCDTQQSGGPTEVPAPSGTCSLLVRWFSCSTGYGGIPARRGFAGIHAYGEVGGRHPGLDLVWRPCCGMVNRQVAMHRCGAGIALHIKGFFLGRCEAGIVNGSCSMLGLSGTEGDVCHIVSETPPVQWRRAEKLLLSACIIPCHCAMLDHEARR